jgi:hypothetical protein
VGHGRLEVALFDIRAREDDVDGALFAGNERARREKIFGLCPCLGRSAEALDELSAEDVRASAAGAIDRTSVEDVCRVGELSGSGESRCLLKRIHDQVLESQPLAFEVQALA